MDQTNTEWEARVLGESPVEIVNGVEYMRNSLGHLIPVSVVADRDKLEDQLVRGIVTQFEDMQSKLKDLKNGTMADLRAFQDVCAERWGVVRKGKKGGVQLTTYDGEYTVTISVDRVLRFNSDLEIAENLVSDCVRKWTEGSRPEVLALIDQAFRRDENGNLSTKAVLELRALQIDDEDWKKAMQIISGSLRVASTRDYVRVHKKDENGKPLHISLNISGL